MTISRSSASSTSPSAASAKARCRNCTRTPAKPPVRFVTDNGPLFDADTGEVVTAQDEAPGGATRFRSLVGAARELMLTDDLPLKARTALRAFLSDLDRWREKSRADLPRRARRNRARRERLHRNAAQRQIAASADAARKLEGTGPGDGPVRHAGSVSRTRVAGARHRGGKRRRQRAALHAARGQGPGMAAGVPARLGRASVPLATLDR